MTYELLDINLNKLGEYSGEDVESIMSASVNNESSVIETIGLNFFYYDSSNESFLDEMKSEYSEDLDNIRFFKAVE